MVTGGKVKDDSIDLTSISTLVIVGRNPESVSTRWLQKMKQADGMQVLSCASLAQMLPFLSRLRIAAANADGLQKIPAASFFRLGQSTKQPWLVGLSDGNSESKTEIVIAQAAEDIEAWADTRGLKITTAMNISMLATAIDEMRRVQCGTSAEEIYATSSQDADDFFGLLNSRSVDEKRASRERAKRIMAASMG